MTTIFATSTSAEPVTNCPTIAALRTTEPAYPGQPIAVASYYADGKGGGGDFYYDHTDMTSRDDGGSILVTHQGKRWKRMFNAAAPGDYRWFGARLDGVSDDRRAFMNAHRACKHLVFSGQLFLADGVDLTPLVTGQQLGITIEGTNDDGAVIVFNTEKQGFYFSGGFFRGLALKNLELRNNKTTFGVGLHVQNAGCEHLSIEGVCYRGWKVGRATHQWNSFLTREVFRSCIHACCIQGASTHVGSPYVWKCSKGYYLGFALDDAYEPVKSAQPFACSSIANAAAEDVGTPYIAGNCNGITMNSCSAERCTDEQVIDLTQLGTAPGASLVWNAFSACVQGDDRNLRFIVKTPAGSGGACVFNSPRLALARAVHFLSGSGAGVLINDPQFNLAEGAQLTQSTPSGVTLDGLCIGDDSNRPGGPGLGIGGYPQVRHCKGMTVIDPHRQELVLRAGLLHSGLETGRMLAAEIRVFALQASGNLAAEKTGTLQFSTSYDYPQGIDDAKSQNVLRLGSLTEATSIRRQDRGRGDAQVIEYRIKFEAGLALTKRMICLDFWCNGIYQDDDHRDWYIADI
ncbi:Uncharacterised protein [Serratia entomophila]|uniref:hypothetical protein n=1 Tax=Serratia entomophila TaxID=42906 RepID=UPI00217BCC66|nr:hypothetical protein [Serratia entomophila]CAI0756956.1 Uncharacterised protein [Serratia entomophila]CAI1634942.1 Uncharacterised protein [Serratia entomophila]